MEPNAETLDVGATGNEVKRRVHVRPEMHVELREVSHVDAGAGVHALDVDANAVSRVREAARRQAAS